MIIFNVHVPLETLALLKNYKIKNFKAYLQSIRKTMFILALTIFSVRKVEENLEINSNVLFWQDGRNWGQMRW